MAEQVEFSSAGRAPEPRLGAVTEAVGSDR
jgi:hypothetical protein